jgi:hypothetical protein
MHLMLLVKAIENLLNPKIKKSELQIIQHALIKNIILKNYIPNIHGLFYLVQYTESFGP